MFVLVWNQLKKNSLCSLCFDLTKSFFLKRRNILLNGLKLLAQEVEAGLTKGWNAAVSSFGTYSTCCSPEMEHFNAFSFCLQLHFSLCRKAFEDAITFTVSTFLFLLHTDVLKLNRLKHFDCELCLSSLCCCFSKLLPSQMGFPLAQVFAGETIAS